MVLKNKLLRVNKVYRYWFRGCKIDKKNTSGTCQFSFNILVSWFSKKQNFIALSTTKVEYISLKVVLKSYGLSNKFLVLELNRIKCDNISAINLSKNRIYTKYIEIRLNFSRDLNKIVTLN